MIRRFLFIITVLLLVSAASLGIRGALHLPVTAMIMSGATQIEVLQPHMSERMIIYDLPGPPYVWRTMVERDLVTHGWARPLWWRPDMPATFTYQRVSSFWFGSIWDSVELDGEPNVVRMRVRRWIELPWSWKSWMRYVSQNIAA